MKYFLILITLTFTSSMSLGETIRLALDIDPKWCDQLVLQLNKNIPEYDFEVISITYESGNKQRELDSNSNHIFEGGYKMYCDFYEKLNKTNIKPKVILHADYYNSFGNELSVSGYIITKNPDLKLDDIDLNTAIFGIHNKSSSGSCLQQKHLKDNNINISEAQIQYPRRKDKSSKEFVIGNLAKVDKSIGFIQSYIFDPHVDKSGIFVIGQSKKYPGGMIFVNSKIVNDELAGKLQKELNSFYKTIWKGGPEYNARLMNVPNIKFIKEFSDPQDAFKSDEKQWWEHTPVQVFAVLFIVIVPILVTALYNSVLRGRKLQDNLKDRAEKDLPSILKALNIDAEHQVISNLIEKRAGEIPSTVSDLLQYTEDLMGLISSDDYSRARESINNLTLKSEYLLSEIIERINNDITFAVLFTGNFKEIFNGDNYMYKVEQFKVFCDKLDRDMKVLLKNNPKIPKKMGQMIYLTGPFLLLASYRNKTAHENGFKPIKEHVLTTSLASICILRYVLESELFVTD